MGKSIGMALGATVLGATAILGQASLEKPPEVFQKLMKQIGPTNQGIGKKVDGVDYEGVAKDAASLSMLFAEVEKFWKERNIEDAVKFAGMAQKAAAELETAATTKNVTEIAEARKMLGGQCQGCHTAHRDKMPDGTFGIK